jgi:hypothetical protein
MKSQGIRIKVRSKKNLLGCVYTGRRIMESRIQTI